MERQFQNPTSGRQINNSIQPIPNKPFNDFGGFGISKIGIYTKNMIKSRGAARNQMRNYTSDERDQINAAPGDTIFNTTTSKFQGYDGTSWNNLS